MKLTNWNTRNICFIKTWCKINTSLDNFGDELEDHQMYKLAMDCITHVCDTKQVAGPTSPETVSMKVQLSFAVCFLMISSTTCGYKIKQKQQCSHDWWTVERGRYCHLSIVVHALWQVCVARVPKTKHSIYIYTMYIPHHHQHPPGANQSLQNHWRRALAWKTSSVGNNKEWRHVG